MAALFESLGGFNVPRILEWSGGLAPKVSAVPVGSIGDQPLYGLGANLSAVYSRDNVDEHHTCF